MPKSQWQLPKISDTQKDWIINARACGMSFAEIAEHFPEMYPDYATEIPQETLVPLLTHRLGYADGIAFRVFGMLYEEWDCVCLPHVSAIGGVGNDSA